MKLAHLGLALAGAASAACYGSSYHPLTINQFPQITSTAVIVYENDIRWLAKCGGEPIGRISAGGNAYTSVGGVSEYAAGVASERGATHIVVADTGVSTTTWYETTYSDRSATTMPVHIRKPKGEYLAVRVSHEDWNCLPENMRPQSLAE